SSSKKHRPVCASRPRATTRLARRSKSNRSGARLGRRSMPGASQTAPEQTGISLAIPEVLRNSQSPNLAYPGVPSKPSDGKSLQCFLKASKGSRHARHLQSALQGVDPNRLTSSVFAEPQWGQGIATDTNRCGGAML